MQLEASRQVQSTAADDAAVPVIYPDVQYARRYRYHVVMYPGDDEQHWHIRLHALFQEVRAKGYRRVLISLDDGQEPLELDIME